MQSGGYGLRRRFLRQRPSLSEFYEVRRGETLRRLYRSKEDRKISGICGGLGEL
ncbi:MAG: hypothetical protein DRQ14_06360, partial [Candidatus Latescibacterota bacterium]